MKNRIKDLRAERAWTQADLAKRVGVSRQTINAIETGEFDPSIPVAFRFAKLFNLRIEELFLDEQRSAPVVACASRPETWSRIVPRLTVPESETPMWAYPWGYPCA